MRPDNHPATDGDFFNLCNPSTSRATIFAESFKGLPPATIILAEFDVLANDGKACGEKLKADGVEVTPKEYKGVTPGFFGMGAVIDKAKEAEDFAAAQLKQAFADSTVKAAQERQLFYTCL